MKKLLFVDTNIWLDFYRSRTDAGLTLLQHLDAIKDQIVITHQVEMEFKKHRQAVILEALCDLKAPSHVFRPALFSDAKAARALQTRLRQSEKLVSTLKRKLRRILEEPTVHDPVYKVCQRVFHKDDSLNLSRDKKIRREIRRKAFRRFILGYPPRKQSDTSIGDSVNWEWIVHCAIQRKAEVILVSRDSDYGMQYEDGAFVNDHLLQEFRERVSMKRKVILCTRLAVALKSLQIEVSAKEEAEENALVKSSEQKLDAQHRRDDIRKWIEEYDEADELDGGTRA